MEKATAAENRVTKQSSTGQEEGQISLDSLNVYLELSEQDGEQASQLFIRLYIAYLGWLVKSILQCAMDSGMPEMAEQIEREFLALANSTLPDALSRTRDEFRQLWPRLQHILCEMKAQGLEVVDLHWPIISETLNSMRERGCIPSEVTNEEILADMLLGHTIVRQVPPGHPALGLFGLENEGQWDRLTPAQRQVLLCHVFTERKEAFARIASRVLHRWAEDSSTSSVSQERLVHGDKFLQRVAAKSDEPHGYLSDADRLSQFCELAGIDMNMLTDGESNRILDILHAIDAGYDFASKQGVSMTAYYGDKANSEKTQRQRLFEKIREASNKGK